LLESGILTPQLFHRLRSVPGRIITGLTRKGFRDAGPWLEGWFLSTLPLTDDGSKGNLPRVEDGILSPQHLLPFARDPGDRHEQEGQSRRDQQERSDGELEPAVIDPLHGEDLRAPRASKL
jgi:hypothetical protein